MALHLCFVSSHVGVVGSSWAGSSTASFLLGRRFLATSCRGRAFSPSKWVARSDQPPKVKPAFYKNPSKAIEKGGGFYIPGLRGPRLRYFVGGLLLVLISKNVASSPVPLLEQPVSFLVSAAIGILGSLGVLATALQDSVAEGKETSVTPAKPSESTFSASQNAALENGNMLAGTDFPELRKKDVFEHIAWVADVVQDMIGCDTWLFRGAPDKLLCVFNSQSRGSPTGTSQAGPVVQRVAKEGRALYVSDSSTLPEGIDFPFLQGVSEGSSLAFSVFSIPFGSVDGVLVVGCQRVGSISAEDRRWVETLVDRLRLALVG